MTASRKEILEALSALAISVRDEDYPFSSGNHGFFIGGRTKIKDTPYQVSCSIVKVKVKPKAAKKEQKGKIL